MKKLIQTAFWLSLFLTITSSRASAFEVIAGPSAFLKNDQSEEKKVQKNVDERVIKLRDYLEKQQSDLVDFAPVFVAAADQNGLDWRLLPAIAGVESTFGKHKPLQSYNPFGWGIYGNTVTRFSSYQEAIETVAIALSQKYPDDLRQIARLYCPLNCQKWFANVTFFIKQIDNAPVKESLQSLNLTL